MTHSEAFKLADFGLASRLTDVTSDGARGTPYFMSPGVVRNEAKSARLRMASYVRGVGAIVCQMATGCPPYSKSPGKSEPALTPFQYYFLVGSIQPSDRE